MEVLVTEQDFHDLALAYLRRAAADGVVRAEIFFDPQAHTSRGVPFSTVIDGTGGSAVQEAPSLGVDAALIMCFLRDHSADSARETLEASPPLPRTASSGWAWIRTSAGTRRRSSPRCSPRRRRPATG